MRCTAEILSDVKDNIEVSYEELRLALLVMDAINFLNHGRFKNLLRGGTRAELERKNFPGANAELGISKHEHDAMHMDPTKYLGPEHIPGTEEYAKIHDLAVKLFNKFVQDVEKE